MKKKLKDIKIIHVGNIANNAYLNSKFLREEGIQSDVLCYDYYHIMGCPEWEDTEISGDYGNDFNPNWLKVNLGGFRRPNWFMQGPFENVASEYFNWHPIENFAFSQTTKYISKIHTYFYKLYLSSFDKRNIRFNKVFTVLSKSIGLFFNLAIRYLFWAEKQLKPRKDRIHINQEERRYSEGLIDDFKKYFPERKDKLKPGDYKYFLHRARIFKSIFKKYDIVQCYATDPIFALLANKRPYVAFEHGTLREIPFEKSSYGRLTALAYRKADLVFVTNSDSLAALKKLGIKNYVVLPHPLDNYWHKKFRNISHGKDKKILFCPVRHDWKVKGINLYLEALPAVINKTNCQIELILLEWGMDVEKSKNLIKKLRLEKYVTWLPPLPRHRFVYWLAKSDIVLDQLILPAMGGIAPEAMQAGKPVLISYSHKISRWMFPKKPPVVGTYNKQDIVNNLTKFINNPKLAQKIGNQGRRWFAKYYSKNVVKKTLIANYKRLVNKY